MFKRILIATDGSASAESATSYTVALARAFDAAVAAVSVVDSKLLMGPLLRDLAGSIGFGNFENAEPQIRTLLTEKAEAALAFVEGACQAEDVVCERVVTEGHVAAEIVAEADFADLVVMGKAGEHAEIADTALGSIAEAVVRGSSRPVLLTPSTYRPITTALAAYDRSSYAFDALRALAEMTKGVEMAVHVLTVGDSEAEANEVLRRGQAHMLECGVQATGLARTGHAEEAIVAAASEVNADLIAMGAYGHSRIRELIVGSTTEHVMRQCAGAFLAYR